MLNLIVHLRSYQVPNQHAGNQFPFIAKTALNPNQMCHLAALISQGYRDRYGRENNGKEKYS